MLDVMSLVSLEVENLYHCPHFKEDSGVQSFRNSLVLPLLVIRELDPQQYLFCRLGIPSLWSKTGMGEGFLTVGLKIQM